MQSTRISRFLLKEKTFDSSNIFKRAILRGQLSLLGAVVGTVYILIDLSNHVFVNIPFYLALIASSALVFWINRIGSYKIANFIFLVTLAFLIYAFADNDSNRTGVHLYFIIYALISLTLCGYENIRWGIFFSLLGLLGFFIAYYWDLPPLIARTSYSKVYLDVSFMTNFVVSFLVGLALLYFSLEVNFKTEKELRVNNQLLTKANKELDRFVYSASHDLRAPLSSLLGLIEISQRTDDQEEIKQCLSMMRVRISDLDVFIREIIDYSRNTRQEIRFESFNLLELLKEVSEGLKFGTGMEDVFIKYLLPNDLMITSDRSRLKVILNNLIGNALKYVKPNAEDQLVAVEASQEQNRLTIKIQDNGIGIADEHLPKIFEMFYRASEKSQGSGLGLYIVKETLDKLNGKIHVTSHLGLGTTFQIEIPVR